MITHQYIVTNFILFLVDNVDPMLLQSRAIMAVCNSIVDMGMLLIYDGTTEIANNVAFETLTTK
jgi:hypothetical protein